MNQPAVRIQLVKSAVEPSDTIEKILAVSNLKPWEINRTSEKVEILNPKKNVTIMTEKDWIAFQKIGEKTLGCILNVWND